MEVGRMKIQRRRSRNAWGFTMIEILVVVIVVGLLATIAAPAWQGFLNNQRLGTAQNEVYLAIREAQSNARRTKERWFASFRTLPSGQSQFAVLRVPENLSVSGFTSNSCDSFPWRNLESSIRVSYVSSVPTLGACANDARYIGFDKDGNYTTGLLNAGVRIRSANGGGRRCVVITTILGSVRQLTEVDSGCPA